MFGPPSPRRGRSRRRTRSARTVLLTVTIVSGLLLLTLGVPSVSYTTGELTREGNIPLVAESSESNAVHGLDKASSATDGQTDPLVNVSNNFGTGSKDLGYRVKLLNNTDNASLNVSGTDQGNVYDFTRAPSDPAKKINITTDGTLAGNTVKYAVNVTNQTLTANATRTIDVTS